MHRWRNFLIMLPFFLIGIALPVYYFGLTGDDTPASVSMSEPSYSSPAAPDDQSPTYSARRYERPGNFDFVSIARNMFDSAVDTWVSPSLSPLTIKLLVMLGVFVGGFAVVRIVIALLTSLFGGFAKAAMGFILHKALAPMFMGFLAVGSTWGIHQTVAEQFGMGWAAVTVAMTAAVATLFALAGIRFGSA